MESSHATSRAEGDEGRSSRRDFLARAGITLAGAGLLAAGAGALRFALPAFEGGPSPRFSPGRLADFRVNTLTRLLERDLFVMRSPEGIGVFSARCTHLGCTVQRTAEGFVCPCHGARYGPLGEVVSGPARKALPWYQVWIEPDGRLWVDLRRRLDRPGPRPVPLPAGEEG